MTQYSKYNIVYRLQKWMDSVPGQTFLNYGYSWGASVVILGALFKLTHLPGANVMLYFGMGTEVIVFFLSAFDRPFDKTDDGRDLPTHITDEYLDGTESEAGTTEHHTVTVPSAAEVAATVQRTMPSADDIAAAVVGQQSKAIADAQQQAMILAGDQEVVRLAQQQADGIRDQADQYERDTRYNAEEYADTVLAHLEENLKSLTNSVSRVRQTLDENSGPRNTTNNVNW